MDKVTVLLLYNKNYVTFKINETYVLMDKYINLRSQNLMFIKNVVAQ